MSDFKKEYALWDEFLRIWPVARLAKMTLDEYTQAGSKESFTYWIESQLDQLGSIWGGSSFKFGVFSRKDTDDKASDGKLSYSETHGWYTSLGASPEEAFVLVRSYVVQVATLAAQGDLDGIEKFDKLGAAYKWKIAFHYQNRQAPVIVGIFKRAPLAVFVGDTAASNMSVLQRAALSKRPLDLSILEFGHQIWAAWSKKNLAIWKLSHGITDFSVAERQQYLQAELAVMHGETAKGQGDKFKEVPVGSLFYLCHGNENLLLVGQFTSDALPCEKGEGWLQRSYRVLKLAVKTGGYQGAQKGWTPNYRSTFKLVIAQDLPEFENNLLKPFFDIDLAELAGLVGERVEAVSLENNLKISSTEPVSPIAKKPIGTPLNRIYYGPPGTGKTYALAGLLKSNYLQTIQPVSAEEWCSQLVSEKIATLKWWECAAAALYDLGGKAKVAEIAEHRFIQALATAKNRMQGIKETLWGTLQHHAIESSNTVKMKLRLAPAIFDKTEESEWQFAGDWQEVGGDLMALVDQFNTGPNEAGEVQCYSFVTFHQSYGYEEFVEGLRPVLNDDAQTGEIQYEIRPGVFKELCRKARLAPDQRFAMVIDEINRGNISKIFGELITLIEADKRDPLDGNRPPFEVTLPYSGEKFSVPANVDVIGTMNTADRSLALLDTALRRRFDFVALQPDTRAEKDPNEPSSAPLAGLVVTLDADVIDVRQMLHRINQRIEVLYDRDHCIGHAYFITLLATPDGQARFDSLKQIFRNRILPLLEEYFFEDWQKIWLVLGDNQKKDHHTRFIHEDQDHQQDLNRLFSSNHGLDAYITKRRFYVQESAFSKPDAYIGIYQTPNT